MLARSPRPLSSLLQSRACRRLSGTSASPPADPRGTDEERDEGDDVTITTTTTTEAKPPPPPTTATNHHFLPERYRDWLDGVAHGWWRRGMLARLRKDHRLSGGGREETLLADIERHTEQLMKKYWNPRDLSWMDPAHPKTNATNASTTTDEAAGTTAAVSAAATARDKSHIRSACRVLATHRALSPWMTDAAALLAMIKEHNGAEQVASGMLSGGVAAAMTLSRDPAALVVRMLRGLAYDHGDRGWDWRESGPGGRGSGGGGGGGGSGGCGETEGDTAVPAARMPDRFGSVEGLRSSLMGAPPSPPPPSPTPPFGDSRPDAAEDEAAAAAFVFEMASSRCLYHAMYAAEGVPELAKATCCSVDGEAWFAHGGRFGVAVRREEALSEGDGRCVLRVERR